MKAHFNAEGFNVKIDRVLFAEALNFVRQFSLGVTVAIGHKNGPLRLMGYEENDLVEKWKTRVKNLE